jgi:hypothetical protein
MSLDIDHILNGWPFRPGEINVRRITGDDGLERIQLRLDLGILQMHVDGRPDGKRPHDFESLLSYHEHRRMRHEAENPDGPPFRLDAEQCEQLRTESVMFYHRYLAAFVLGDYELVARDTARNLALIDFCHAYAEADPDRAALQRYRPYILMMNARARSRLAVKQNRHRQARTVIQNTIEKIEHFYQQSDQEEMIEASTELAVLHALDAEIEESMPVDPVTLLRRQLNEAIAEERYEEAAELRDALRQQYGQHDSPDLDDPTD